MVNCGWHVIYYVFPLFYDYEYHSFVVMVFILCLNQNDGIFLKGVLPGQMTLTTSISAVVSLQFLIFGNIFCYRYSVCEKLRFYLYPKLSWYISLTYRSETWLIFWEYVNFFVPLHCIINFPLTFFERTFNVFFSDGVLFFFKEVYNRNFIKFLLHRL